MCLWVYTLLLSQSTAVLGLEDNILSCFILQQSTKLLSFTILEEVAGHSVNDVDKICLPYSLKANFDNGLNN